ncbi:MAG: beta-ketoacyl-[acyl-carrier-protein] synthase family protein [Nitrospirota bacterium]|jgi:3-oxoacyl-[acyl-carrier-protein] synthase II
MSARRVVITGMGVATSNGLEVPENWRKALDGVSGLRKLDYPGAENSPVQAVGQITEDDWRRIAEEFPEDARREGERSTLYALWSARRALEEAGLVSGGRRGRFGVSMAKGLGINRPEDISSWLSGGGSFDYGRFGRELHRVHRESIIRNLTHCTSGLIARKFSLGGLNRTVTTACASATQAIGTAFRSVRRGEADAMVAGGTDSMINPVGLVFFVLLGAASTWEGDPALACRPYDRRRSGLVMGEGAGVVVLEELSHALERGAAIHAEVAGYGASLDSHELTAPHPEGYGAEISMRRALEDSGLGPEDIDHINAHGTSTKLNDAVETMAIKRVFGSRAPAISINSTKSMLGHLLAGAGGPELVFTALSVREDVVHPTLNLDRPDPKCDLDYTAGVKRERRVRAALSNSFGFGGQNSTIAVKKYQP